MSKMKDLAIAEMNGDRLNEAALVREASGVPMSPAVPEVCLAAPTMTQQVIREEYVDKLVEHNAKQYANRSDSTLIQILTEKDAEIAELKRQYADALEALGKEKAALNQTLKKVAEMDQVLTSVRFAIHNHGVHNEVSFCNSQSRRSQ